MVLENFCYGVSIWRHFLKNYSINRPEICNDCACNDTYMALEELSSTWYMYIVHLTWLDCLPFVLLKEKSTHLNFLIPLAVTDKLLINAQKLWSPARSLQTQERSVSVGNVRLICMYEQLRHSTGILSRLCHHHWHMKLIHLLFTNVSSAPHKYVWYQSFLPKNKWIHYYWVLIIL